jgi:hypothetical protein
LSDLEEDEDDEEDEEDAEAEGESVLWVFRF